MKVYVRTLWGDDKPVLWENPAQRDALRQYLNDQGFYVLTGIGDSLDVHVLDYSESWDIKLMKKGLDKLQKVWYTFIKRQKETE